jgi:hypothetical protein
MRGDDLATKVLKAVDGNPDAIKAISDALASGDPAAIQGALSTHAGIDISAEEAQEVAAAVQANPGQPAAYCT